MGFFSRVLFWSGFAAGAYKAYQQFPHILQNGLLMAGSNQRGRKFLRTLPSSAKTADNYVAGATLDDAIIVAKQLNEAGKSISLAYLGETEYSHQTVVNRKEIASMFPEMGDVRGDVTISPSSLGLRESIELAQGNLRLLLDQADGTMIWLDADDHSTATDTIALYQFARSTGYDNLGVTIQCALYRAWGDVNRLAEQGGGRIRLTIGLPNEPSEHAFPQAKDGRENLIRIANFAITHPDLQVGLMTTDEDVLQAAMNTVREHHLGKDAIELVLPFNVKQSLQTHLVSEGYAVSIYLPWGEAWESYVMERLADNPADAVLLFGNL